MFAVDGWNYPFSVLLRQVTSSWRLRQQPREKLARLFFRPSAQKSYPFRVMLDGIVYRGQFGEYLDWRVFFLGGFERETINLCRFLAQHAHYPTFCDIGANRGLFSVLLARSYREVYAFEPLEVNVALLQSGLDENGLRNVEILPFALGEAEAVAKFYLPPEGNRGSGSFVEGHLEGTIETRQMTVRRGDAVFREAKIHPGVIKIDTEGFEWQVLLGLRATLEEDRPFIVMEIGDSSKAAIRAGGGLDAALPPDYCVLEISDHTTTPEFYLKLLEEAEVLTRGISNNLACPAERLELLAPYIAGWASPQMTPMRQEYALRVQRAMAGARR